MKVAGANNKEATDLGLALVNADYRSHYSHGLNRLEFYFNDMRAGAIDSSSNKQVNICHANSKDIKSEIYFKIRFHSEFPSPCLCNFDRLSFHLRLVEQGPLVPFRVFHL